MTDLIKQTLRRSLGLLGCESRRDAPSLSALEVQRLLVERESPMIFDVGANVGTVTQDYRRLFPTAVIHAFEPFPESFAWLVQNTASDPNVFAHELAVSDHKGTCLLNSNASAVTNSMLATDPRGREAWGEGLLETAKQVEVQTTTIDSFCQENGISAVDILKLDIQGAELIALDGARDSLSRQAISLIYLEIILADTYRGQPKLHEYIQWLDSVSYRLFDFYNPVRSNLELIQLDAIFLSSTFREGLRR